MIEYFCVRAKISPPPHSYWNRFKIFTPICCECTFIVGLHSTSNYFISKGQEKYCVSWLVNITERPLNKNKNLVSQGWDGSITGHQPHYALHSTNIYTVHFSWRQRHSDLGSASQSRRHQGCSLAWLNCSVLRSALAGPLALGPVNPAVTRGLLGNVQGTVEACQYPLLFRHACIHTLFNSSAQNTRGLKETVTWIFHRWWNGQEKLSSLLSGNRGIWNSFAVAEQ